MQPVQNEVKARAGIQIAEQTRFNAALYLNAQARTLSKTSSVVCCFNRRLSTSQKISPEMDANTMRADPSCAISLFGRKSINTDWGPRKIGNQRPNAE